MTGQAVIERRLRIGEVSALLRIPVSTVSRLFDDGVLRIVSTGGWRMAYESQVGHIAAALNARRPGSIEEFGREWLTAHPLPVAGVSAA